MNEIVRKPEADQAQASPVDLRSYVDHNSKMRESSDISKIAPSLVRAQAAMENPPRNRSVQVRTQAGSYNFRYATLDKITDMTRRVLAENGLCVLQPIVSTERGAALVTRLLHESGQWMECEVVLPPLGQNPQAFGSAITYMRRYSISALLNISADEDDDANRAAGNHYADTTPRKDRGRREEPVELGEAVGDAVARAIVNRARLAEGLDEGHQLLDAWLKRATVLEKLRGTKAWEVLEREIGGGLKRSLGVEPASAFVAALRAADASQVAALQERWEGKWAETLASMQQEAPATYALLRRHVAAQIARVRAATGEAPAPASAAPAAPAFQAQLRDAEGEVDPDPITDPVAFAEAYAGLWRATEPASRRALARQNGKALVLAAKTQAARAVLDALTTGTPSAGDRAEAQPAN